MVSFAIEVDAVDNVQEEVEEKNIEKEEKEQEEENKEEETTLEADNQKENESTENSSEAATTEAAPSSISSNTVVVTLDASLQRSSLNSPDASMSYPFFKPKAYIASGTHLLPPSPDLNDGCRIQIDCDWTPSLHLNDAVLNIALKVRESVKRGELCLKVEGDKQQPSSSSMNFDSKVYCLVPCA